MYAVKASAWVWAPVVSLMLATASAAVEIATVPVGDVSNAPDTRYANLRYGAVSYPYQIGKYEVTAGQYTEFLNAVAKTDTYGLYHPNMGVMGITRGCNIIQTGQSGNYRYSVAPDWANRPVNYVNWGSAARFVNWLSNGQPIGNQGSGTTEDGSYLLNGATTDAALAAVPRSPSATWALPTRDEWYKAAYYDPNKPGGAGYWSYPTRSDLAPSNLVVDPDPGNNANFYGGQTPYAGYCIGSPYYRTNAGEFEKSASAYGTFDQGGNVWEWYGDGDSGYRNFRGGGFRYGDGFTNNEGSILASYAQEEIGFRVVQVPEPVSLALLAFAGLGWLARRR